MTYNVLSGTLSRYTSTIIGRSPAAKRMRFGLTRLKMLLVRAILRAHSRVRVEQVRGVYCLNYLFTRI